LVSAEDTNQEEFAQALPIVFFVFHTMRLTVPDACCDVDSIKRPTQYTPSTSLSRYQYHFLVFGTPHAHARISATNMTTNSEPTASEPMDNHPQTQPEPQQITGEDPTRKAISEALELIYKNLESTMNKWDTLGGVWGSGLFDELARSCRDLQEVAELMKAKMDSAEGLYLGSV
jgi:hypothetical protein